MLLGPCPAVPLFMSTASFQRADTVSWTALGPALAPVMANRARNKAGKLKPNPSLVPRETAGGSTHCWSEGLGASFLDCVLALLPHLIPGKTQKPSLQSCWEEGKSLDHDWDSLVGGQAGSQTEFFKLETQLESLERCWSQGAKASSVMAREEDEEKSKRLASVWWLVAARPRVWEAGTHTLMTSPAHVSQGFPSLFHSLGLVVPSAMLQAPEASEFKSG